MIPLFHPAVTLMNRLKYPQKFLLISLLFAMPLTYTVTELFRQIDSRIEFTHKEIYGNAYLRPLMGLMQQVPQVRDLRHDQRRGQLVATALHEQQTRIDALFQSLESVDQTYGQVLDSTTKLAALKQSWQELKVATPNLTLSENDARYAKFIKDIRTLIAHVGNTSNLILDPDLDTYYTMDSVLLKLPEAVELLAQSQSFSEQTFGHQTISAQEKAQIDVLVGLIEANTSAMQSGLETAKRNNPRKNLEPALREPLQDAIIARSQMLKLLKQKASGLDARALSPDTYTTKANIALNSSFHLWDRAVSELDRLLQARIDSFTHKKILITVVILVTLVVVLYLWIGFYVAVMATVSSLEKTSQRLVKGDISEAVELDTRDELAQVVKSFNDVLAQLSQANQEINALNESLKADNLRMSAELDVTRRLQQMLLPKERELRAIPGLEIAGFMEPAWEVGGDYYDVLTHDGGVKIGIGDVTGHGLESGVLMIMVQTAVRTLLANNETDPVKFLNVLNHTIYDNVQRMDSDKNLSLLLLDYKEGTLRLSGQHEEMIVIRSGGYLERIDTIDLGFPIGLDADIADFVAHAEVKLNFGDVVVLYTDGITEAENHSGVQYGVGRLCEVVKQNWQASAEKIRQVIIEDVRRHIGEHKVYDDITLVVFKQK